MSRSRRRILITPADHERLQRLVDQHLSGRNAERAEELEVELMNAEIVGSREIPPDVVTMNSTVIFEDEDSGERREVTLCYPHEVVEGNGRVSVLAPVGSALLGLSVGDSIEWPVPGGWRRLRIVAVPFQPEAAVDLERQSA